MKLTTNTLHSQKLNVFYRRVSTENQSLEMQIAADKNCREILDDDEYVEFNELGVSANKVKMKDRKQLLKVIELIKEDRVDSLYVYDRSRLARNFYEYLELVDLFSSYGVKVFFTTTDQSYPSFSGNYVLEGFNAILIEEEGKAIARRISDIHRKLPNRKFGFLVEKDGESKKYFLENESKEILRKLFSEAALIKNVEEFLQLITKYSSELKKPVSDVIRILSDPFYAASEKLGEKYSQLSYVEVLVELEQFKKVQDNIEPFIKRFQEDVQSRLSENVLVPHCGVCLNHMKYKKDKLGKTGVYSCSNKHQKVSIEVDVYNASIKEVIEAIILNLDKDTLKEQVYHSLNEHISKLLVDYESISTQITKQEMDMASLLIDVLLTQKQLLTSLKKLKKKRKEVENSLLVMENHKLNIHYLTKKIVEKLNDRLSQEQLLSLSKLLIKQVLVYDSSLSFQVYFNEYVDRQKVNNELDGVSA